jgi:phosphoserine phosphatase
VTGFQSIVFDCDSTLVRIEGIDELAGPFREQVAALTHAAMRGEAPLEEVYGRRLALIRPSRERVAAVGRMYVDTLMPDAREVVAALRWLGKTVRILSGGVRPAVQMAADALGIPAEHVGAVDLRFDADGEYAGFEDDSPLAASGGKPRVLTAWALPRPALLVGDGATDREAKPAVDAFAAYMGVEFRAPVADGADFVLRDESLAPVLALACSPADRERLRASPWAEVLARGEALEALHPQPFPPKEPGGKGAPGTG